MEKHPHIGLCLFACLLVLSCKKETPTPASPGSGSGRNTQLYDGFFEHGLVSGRADSNTSNMFVARAFFSRVAVDSFSYTGQTLEVDSITLNGSALTKSKISDIDTNTIYLLQTEEEPNDIFDTWIIKEDSTLPSFTYTERTPAPTGLNADDLPETIDITTPLHLHFVSLQHFEKGVVQVTNQGAPGIAYPITPATTSLTIPAAALQQPLQIHNAGFLMVTLYSHNEFKVGGKRFHFTRTRHVYRLVHVKN